MSTGLLEAGAEGVSSSLEGWSGLCPPQTWPPLVSQEVIKAPEESPVPGLLTDDVQAVRGASSVDGSPLLFVWRTRKRWFLCMWDGVGHHWLASVSTKTRQLHSLWFLPRSSC